MVSQRPSARRARSLARDHRRAVVEVWWSPRSGWRSTTWAPNGRVVGASEEGLSSRAAMVRRHLDVSPVPRVIVVASRWGLVAQVRWSA